MRTCLPVSLILILFHSKADIALYNVCGPCMIWCRMAISTVITHCTIFGGRSFDSSHQIRTGTSWFSWCRSNRCWSSCLGSGLDCFVWLPELQKASYGLTVNWNLFQVAHFNTPFNYNSLESVHKALNGLLPSDIRIREIRSVVPEFHARFSVKSKIYTYKIYNDAIMDPFHRLYAYHSLYKLNASAMRLAARHFVGKHDFSAFANASRNDRTPNPVKNIIRFDVNEMVFSLSNTLTWLM